MDINTFEFNRDIYPKLKKACDEVSASSPIKVVWNVEDYESDFCILSASFNLHNTAASPKLREYKSALNNDEYKNYMYINNQINAYIKNNIIPAIEKEFTSVLEKAGLSQISHFFQIGDYNDVMDRFDKDGEKSQMFFTAQL